MSALHWLSKEKLRLPYPELQQLWAGDLKKADARKLLDDSSQVFLPALTAWLSEQQLMLPDWIDDAHIYSHRLRLLVNRFNDSNAETGL